MREIKTSEAQTIVNKCNSKKEFTHKVTDNKNNYIVSFKSLYKGKNPSLDFKLLSKIEESIKLGCDSIGLWYDKGEDVFCIDANLHIHSLDFALKVAKVKKQKAIYSIRNKRAIFLSN